MQLPKDVDSILPLLSAAISTVSTVNCTSAPQNCFDDFNRLPCAQVSGTCGKCRPGFVGEDSDSNTPCIDPADFLLLNNTLKPCEGNCSSHGSCIYVQVNTDEEINECMITDVNCKAICDCHDGYSGSSCSMDEAELTDKMTLKSQILKQVKDIINLDTPSQESVASWTALLNGVGNNKDEISLTTSTAIISTAGLIMGSANALNLPHEVFSNTILTNVDNAIGSTMTNAGKRRRRLDSNTNGNYYYYYHYYHYHYHHYDYHYYHYYHYDYHHHHYDYYY